MSNSEKGLLHHQSHGSLLQKWKLENVFHFPISAYGTSDAHMWSAIHCLEYDRWIKILELVCLGRSVSPNL